MKKKKLMTVTFACAALAALAGEKVFTGATSMDLSDAANWPDGTLPGTDDVAVVDFATLDASVTELSNSTDLAFGGLVLTNATQAVTLRGTNTADAVATTITLGVSGLRAHRAPDATAKSLTFAVNLATSADQIWSLVDEQTIAFNGTISGTAALTVSNALELVHNVAPGYGGAITYAGPSTQRVALAKKGAWAQSVTATDGRLELRFGDEAKWSDIFTGRTASAGDGSLQFTGAPKVTFESGDVYTAKASDLKGSLTVGAGRFVQTNGSMTSPVRVGEAGNPAYYEIGGGTLSAHVFEIGKSSATAWTTNQEARMSGGTAATTYLALGSRTGASASPLAYSKFSLAGGTFSVNDSTTGTYGGFGYRGLNFGLNAADGDAGAPDATSAMYHQWGGTMKTPRVLFGSDASTGLPLATVTNSWFLMRLAGGTFNVGAGGFAVDTARWNVPAADAPDVEGNSRYRVLLKGGTLTSYTLDTSYAPFQSTVDLEIPENTTPFVIDVPSGNNHMLFDAPLWGSGAFEKTGSGTLVILDGTRHYGDIAVKAGALKLVGVPATVDDTATCWTWRAEDAVADLENGASITNWPDSTGARSAVYKGTLGLSKPTVELNAFNGHAGVAFKQSELTVAAADNPLAGATNWTVCVVLKTSKWGEYSGKWWEWYAKCGVLGFDIGGKQNDWGICLWGNWLGVGWGVAGKGDNFASAHNDVMDGEPHVLICSLDRNGYGRAVLDGIYETYNYYYVGPQRASQYFYFGTIGGTGGLAFTGAIAEIRFYPDKVLTLNECAALSSELAAKYGALDLSLNLAETGELAAGTSAAMPDDGAVAWDAADLANLEDGALVEDWPSTDGERHATHEMGKIWYKKDYDSAWTWDGANAPKYVKNAFKGRPAVRFSGNNEMLGVSAGDSPVSGATAWTVAMVFRTSMTESGVGSRHFWDSGTGLGALFGAELGGTDKADWGVTFWNEQGLGRIVAGYGGKNCDDVDQDTVSRAFGLNDGEPHILIATFDTDKGEVNIQVDGVGTPAALTKCSASTPRAEMRVQIGGMNGSAPFKGDIAAFRLYNRVLTNAEKQALLDGWTDRFDVPPASRGAARGFTSGRQGLSSTNITVASGASLVLPVAETSPFTLKNGQRLASAGAVSGTLAVGAGGTFDLTSSQPTSMGTLWMRTGGTVKASFNLAKPVALAGFRADGSPVISLTDAPTPLPNKFTLFTYSGDATVADGTTWTVKGASSGSTVVVEDGCVNVYTPIGTTIFLR